MKEMYERAGGGESIRGIARRLGISRNTVRKYLRSPQVPTPSPRPKRGSKLDPYTPYIRQRLAEGVDNCVVLLREIRTQGYAGGYTILKEFVKPYRSPRPSQATMRYETKPGEQAQVDFGRYRYLTPDGQERWVWAFVCLLSWSRAVYVEFVDRADTPSFIRGHVHAWEHFGGVPRRCLYDNTLVEDLRRAQAEHRLERRLRVYLAPRVLIVDEFGVWPCGREGATALFALVSARYERGSIILTSNKGFAEWGEVLGDEVVATAILDRLLHHSHILNIRGQSYRLREKRRAGLFGRGLGCPSDPTAQEAQEER